MDLIDKSRKKLYKETLGKDNDVKKDLTDNIINKSIYIYF